MIGCHGLWSFRPYKTWVLMDTLDIWRERLIMYTIPYGLTNCKTLALGPMGHNCWESITNVIENENYNYCYGYLLKILYLERASKVKDKLNFQYHTTRR